MEFITKTLIEKGWSGDKKYCATTVDGKKYLLRITPCGSGKNRKEMFEMQKKLDTLGVPMCRPIEIGECAEGTYVVQSWIDGMDAKDVLSDLDITKQYVLGIEAGRTLKKIHSVPAPADQPDWEVRFNNKMNRKIKMYNDCPIKFDGAEYIIDYIENNRHLLKDRPQCYQHGDYHIGNMMIENGHIVIIDFDRYDYGDPWEEFKSITWCAQVSPFFASGMVNGYFDNNVPMDFWKLLAFYISLGTIASLTWAIPYGEGEVQTMRNLANEVLEWYDNMRNPVPTWYMPYIERKNLVKSYLGKTVSIKIDRPIGYVHSTENYSLKYPINYGYIPGVLGGDGEELDVYLIGVNEPVNEYTAKVIGIAHRHNDVEDKLIVAPDGVCFTKDEIENAVRFQEQYYETEIEVLK